MSNLAYLAFFSLLPSEFGGVFSSSSSLSSPSSVYSQLGRNLDRGNLHHGFSKSILTRWMMTFLLLGAGISIDFLLSPTANQWSSSSCTAILVWNVWSFCDQICSCKSQKLYSSLEIKSWKMIISLKEFFF